VSDLLRAPPILKFAERCAISLGVGGNLLPKPPEARACQTTYHRRAQAACLRDSGGRVTDPWRGAIRRERDATTPRRPLNHEPPLSDPTRPAPPTLMPTPAPSKPPAPLLRVGVWRKCVRIWLRLGRGPVIR
jgi:hypothetical protein